jgi:hypothetical protein
MKLKVSTNNRGVNKQNSSYLSRGWNNTWLEPWELAAWVQNGFAWAATHFQDRRRSEANASGSNCIVFDFDGELQLDEFWTTKIARKWCVLTYTSSSSTPEVNRFRAIFPLAGMPLSDVWEHKCVYNWVSFELAKELGIEFKDPCGEKPERLWFGNTEAQIQLNDEACIPASVVSAIDIPEPPAFSMAGIDGITDIDVKRCVWLLDNFIPPSKDGEYIEVYTRITAACASIGSVIENAWVNWVSRGHHSSKSSNLDASLKWRGLGQRSGPGSIYAMAKRLDPQWTRKLPAELSFAQSFDTGMSLDAILEQTIKCAPQILFRST